MTIANDHSPNNSDAIVKKYFNENPGRKLIRYFNHAKNLCITPNFLFAINQTEDKYVAIF